MDYTKEIVEKIWHTQFKLGIKNSGLSSKYIEPINLVTPRQDKEAFDYLYNEQANIVENVKSGKSWVIMSSNVGNGKTTWAIKMLQRYLAETAIGNGTRVSVKFVTVPDVLYILSNFRERDLPENVELVKQLKTADLVVFDELGAGDMNKQNYSAFYAIINHRISRGKSSIYTTNYTEEELEQIIGKRLYSRTVNMSDYVEFVSGDKRGLSVEEIS